MHQLNNVRNYVRLSEDPTEQLQRLVSDMTALAVTEGYLTVKEKAFLNPPFPKIPAFYVLPKIHKNLQKPPGRPILSSNERVGQYLDMFLKDEVPRIPSYVKDTTHLLTLLNDFSSIEQVTWLATLDVAALYTSIPQDEALSALCQIWDARPRPHAVPTIFLRDLAEIALKKNYFVYKQEFFQQISGTAMGATFAPSLANLFMHLFEDRWVYISRYTSYIIRWYRYIDDILLLWGGSVDILDDFLSYLNRCNTNIQFEMTKNQFMVSLFGCSDYED